MKWIFRIFLLGFVVFIAVGAFAYFYLKGQEPPDIANAPFAIQTYSQDDLMIPARVYYAENVMVSGGILTMRVYWDKDGDRYHKHNEDKPILEPYKLVRRQ